MHFCRLSQYFDRKYKFVKKSASVIDIESHAAMSTNMYWYSNNAVNAHLKQTFVQEEQEFLVAVNRQTWLDCHELELTFVSVNVSTIYLKTSYLAQYARNCQLRKVQQTSLRYTLNFVDLS